VGKLKGNRLLERSTPRSEDNIKMDLREIGWVIVDWINLSRVIGQCRALAKTEMSLRVS
jgi:hypothetical protein